MPEATPATTRLDRRRYILGRSSASVSALPAAGTIDASPGGRGSGIPVSVRGFSCT
ncbi:hypothetical protein GCM10017786_30630 [Amycolatopsis deserti]|uniref:Uncharacterized protein n=1 Tax=Amycolatopsis deserti TaxID=185696 RepID=A0ABQ3J0X8_9PSEU|nr:hypothetical protein GCM10017786_30630 [Amycolatopsis deserti]